MTATSSVLQAMRSPDTSRPFQRLVPFNWASTLILICAGMVVSFLVAGFWYPYWRVADMDFWIVYNAFLLTDHLPQEYFDHPGYLPILLLSYWLRALHGVGIIRVDALHAVPPVSDEAGFTSAWLPATQAARVLSLIFAMTFVVAFSYLLRVLVRDWRVAAMGGFLLAFSGGLEMQMRIVRTELLAAGFFTIALLLLIIAAKSGARAWRPAVIGCASLLIVLGMMSKIQMLFLLCALPLLLLPFGPDTARQHGFWDTPRRAWPALAASAAIALLAGCLAKDIVSYGLSHNTILWGLVAAWLGFGMVVYWIVWRVAPLEALAAMFAVLAGAMIGLLAFYARYNPSDVAVVFNPMAPMFSWAAASYPQLAIGDTFFSADRLEFLAEAVAGVIAKRTFILSPSSRPTIFVEWFVIAATVVAIRRGEWRLVLQVAALMLTDWGVDILGMSRGLKLEYFILTDPLAIIAAALLISNLTDLQSHRWTYPLGVALIVANIAVSQAEPVKHLFKHGGREALCDPLASKAYYRRLGHFPFCGP